uniref:Uncharacterized protein n=1 Tax=Streptococcus salivarius TaxID=1304 RepID=Q09II6_STRSL|nr:unknown [Streptococcus salivarius K12]
MYIYNLPNQYSPEMILLFLWQTIKKIP